MWEDNRERTFSTEENITTDSYFGQKQPFKIKMSWICLFKHF